MSIAGVYVLLTTHLMQQQIAEDQFQLQRILVTRMASQLDQDMHNRTTELKFLGGLQRLRDPARSVLDKQALLLEKQAAYPFYTWIGVTDTEGHIIASTEPRTNGADVSHRSWFIGGRKGLHQEDIHDAVLLGQLLPPPLLDELPLRLMDIALPLQDQDGPSSVCWPPTSAWTGPTSCATSCWTRWKPPAWKCCWSTATATSSSAAPPCPRARLPT